MKIVLMALGALVAFGLLAEPCHAQINAAPEAKTGAWSQRIEEGMKRESEEKEKKLDAAVKKAGERIPEPKGKLDPWKNAR